MPRVPPAPPWEPFGFGRRPLVGGSGIGARMMLVTGGGPNVRETTQGDDRETTQGDDREVT